MGGLLSARWCQEATLMGQARYWVHTLETVLLWLGYVLISEQETAQAEANRRQEERRMRRTLMICVLAVLAAFPLMAAAQNPMYEDQQAKERLIPKDAHPRGPASEA